MRRAWTALPVLAAMAIAGCGGTSTVANEPPPVEPPRPTAPLNGRPSVRTDQGAQPLRRETVARGFVRPVAMLREPGNSGRILVVEQAGFARWLDGDGPSAGTPFLDLRGQVEFKGEQGLLGATFLPGYERDPRIAVHYTDRDDRTRVVVYRIFDGRVNPFSGEELLTIEQPYGNHNGGELRVGPDRRLYVGMGDGGSAYDPRQNAQNLESPLGKVLRYDLAQDPLPPAALTGPDGTTDELDARIAARTVAANDRWELVAYGLRDPWRLSFDAASGDLWIADTGLDRAQRQTQEVNRIPAERLREPRPPANFGWAGFDGVRDQANRDLTVEGPLSWPVASFVPPGGCGITGGVVVRQERSPFDGRYLLGDQCSGQIWSVRTDGRLPLIMRNERVRIRNLTAFLADDDGGFLVSSGGGGIFRVTPERRATPR
ncbi:MAG: PQQ-dependent sugar dehydrogenase [Patulibacter sp.]|nr:PQQ-dependent sugar dehydrogenase [Patulibacter sp.]